MKHFLGILLMVGFAAVPAAAGVIQVDLSSSAQSGAAGGTLAYFATLTNTSATDTIFINGFSSTTVSADLTVDFLPFLLNGPASLGPLEATSAFEMFDVQIGPGAVAGAYVLNVVTLLGGADGGLGVGFDDLADVNFDVVVSGNTSDVPEPATWVLGSTAVVWMVLRAARRKRITG